MQGVREGGTIKMKEYRQEIKERMSKIDHDPNRWHHCRYGWCGHLDKEE